MAQNKTVPMSILELLSTDPDREVRWMVAAKRKHTRELMERLVRDPDSSVRLRIAYNRSAPLDLVRGLLTDPDPFVVERVKSRLEWMGETV